MAQKNKNGDSSLGQYPNPMASYILKDGAFCYCTWILSIMYGRSQPPDWAARKQHAWELACLL